MSEAQNDPVSTTHAQALKVLLDMIEHRTGKTTCPSEVARRLASDRDDPTAWRRYMPIIHAAVDDLNAQRIITLSWKSIDMPERSGPYRIRPRQASK